MTLLSKHIFKEFISLVVGVLVCILIVYLCVEFLQKADKLIKAHATLSQVARYFLYSLPVMVTMSLPMATLIAALLSLGSLSSHNEIIAMRAGGVSLMKIIAPLLAGGLLVSILGFINNEFIMPTCTSRANYIRSVEIEKKQQQVMFQQSKLWLRGPNNSIANIELVSPNRNEMLGLNIYMLNPDYSVRERITAESLIWENGSWKLKHSRTVAIHGNTVQSRNSDGEVFNIVDNPDDLGMIVKDSEEMNFREMWDYVRQLKSSGYEATKYEVDLHSKLAFPLASLLVVLISIPFSFHKVRSGGAAKGFAFAILIAFTYLTIMGIGQSLGNSNTLPPIIAAWLANIIFAVISLLIL
ncbi:MAG TPA: LPS export ABC transporter permease LptG, partial [Nitrospirota bacterium]|nr:LPS export ABC transporter permease LptG [Nitrospirota bacterium]